MMARELRRHQPRPCKSCFIELPYLVEDRGAHAANWAIALPADCGDDCRAIIEDLFAEYSLRYNLSRER
jgi:hypothetical protein